MNGFHDVLHKVKLQGVATRMVFASLGCSVGLPPAAGNYLWRNELPMDQERWGGGLRAITSKVIARRPQDPENAGMGKTSGGRARLIAAPERRLGYD